MKADKIFFSGDEETYTTLTNAAAADASSTYGYDATTIPATDHGFKSGSHITISGTTYYDGTWEIVGVAANTFDIKRQYVAETFAGTEIAGAYYKAKSRDYIVRSLTVKLSAAPTTHENLVVSIDANKGSAWDTVLCNEDMCGRTDYVVRIPPNTSLEESDVLMVQYSNTNDKTYGIKLEVVPDEGQLFYPEELLNGRRRESDLVEIGLTELIDKDDQVDAGDYSASKTLALGTARTGEIVRVTLATSELDAGGVRTPAGRLFFFDADPSISAGDTALAAAGAEHKTVIGTLDVTSSDWNADTAGAVASLSCSIFFHQLSNIYVSFRPATGATSFNDGATDDEEMHGNFWYLRVD